VFVTVSQCKVLKHILCAAGLK